MKTSLIPGEFAFKALGRCNDEMPWELSLGYFFTKQEAQRFMSLVIWPVEELDNKSIYVPADEELQ